MFFMKHNLKHKQWGGSNHFSSKAQDKPEEWVRTDSEFCSPGTAACYAFWGGQLRAEQVIWQNHLGVARSEAEDKIKDSSL